MVEDSNYLKFPSIIKEKICNGEFVFPDNTVFAYQPILAYRGIQRKANDFTEVSRKDFMSYAEMKVRRRGVNTADPRYYGVSSFLNKESVENALKFPRTDKKIAVGKVCSEAGPAEINEYTGHICWWLYDNIEIEGFLIV